MAASVTEYSGLLAELEPKVVRTVEEADQYLEIISRLTAKGEECLSPAETDFINLLGTLVWKFEQNTSSCKYSTPEDRLRFLVTSHGLKAADLADIFGSVENAELALQGKRRIDQREAGTLSERLHVPPSVFA